MTTAGRPRLTCCVMRRIAERDIPVFQIGVRSICQEEIDYRDAKGIRFLDAVELQRDRAAEQVLPDDFPGNVYLTFDVDGLDSSLMPATGTPEPGGLFWWQALTLVASVVQSGRKLIGRCGIGTDCRYACAGLSRRQTHVRTNGIRQSVA